MQLRVISGPGAGDYVSIERGLEDGDLRKPALWDRMFNRPDYAELLKTEVRRRPPTDQPHSPYPP